MKSKPLAPSADAAADTKTIKVAFSQAELKAIKRFARKLGITVEELMILAVKEHLGKLNNAHQADSNG